MARRVLLLCLVLSLVGCGGVPSHGPVRVVRRVPAEGPDLPEGRSFRRVLPPNPPEDAEPAEIVNGFLLAQANPDSEHAIARRYLAPNVTWNAASPVTIYDAQQVGRTARQGDTATVPVTFGIVGTISPDGEFRPPARPPVPTTFRLRRDPALGWRLAAAPPGLLLDIDDVPDLYQRATLYYPNAARRLVPHLVFLRESDQPVAAVARAMLARPRGWIAPAVRTAIPEGTELLDPPTVVDGVVTLNFSREIRRAPQETIGPLIAQVVWTLTEPSLAVNAVRIQAEGDTLVAPGHGALREHRRTDWLDYDPLPRPSDDRLFFVRDSAAYALDSSGVVARLASLGSVESVAVSRSGSHLAAVTRVAGDRRALVLVSLGGAAPPRQALVADRITPPTWEPGSDVVWAATSNGGVTSVVTVPVAGPPAAVETSLPGGPVESLRLSPDGSRAAVLVTRGSAGASLWVARVLRPGEGARALDDARTVVPSVTDVTAVAFDGVGQIVLAGAYARARTLVRVDVDGYGFQALRVQGLPASPVTALASSAATPPDRIASAGGRLWRRTPGLDWAPLAGTGSGATYAG